MSDTTTPAGATPAPGATPGVSGQADHAEPAGATPSDDQLGTGGKAAIEAERKAARDALKRAEKAEKALSDREAQDLSETERLQKQVADHEREKAEWVRERQQSRLREAAVNAAAVMGFSKPADAPRFLDLAAVEFDPDGNPTNVEKLLAALLKDYPGLASTAAVVGTSDAGRRGLPESSGQPDMNALLRAAAGKG